MIRFLDVTAQIGNEIGAQPGQANALAVKKSFRDFFLTFRHF